jgi:serine/threonine-protein kinase RsbW
MPDDHLEARPLLGRVAPEEFVGRAAELERIVHLASGEAETRGLLLLMEPSAGVSELLRQAYDRLFRARGRAIPIFFSLARTDKTAVTTARRFLHTFLLQLVAYKRNEPSLLNASLNISDLLELAPPSIYDWLERLVETSERERTKGDERAYIRLCLSAPQRATAQSGERIFVMLDAAQLAERIDQEVMLGTEIVQVFDLSTQPFVLAGLRRQILDIVHNSSGVFEQFETIRLERLSDEEAGELVEHLSHRGQVAINEQTRDLIVQEFNGSPLFITALVQAARERRVSLTSFLHCQQLYVDELMGGRINRHFASLLEEMTPSPEIRRALIRMLYESVLGDNGRTPIESWRKKLGLEAETFQRILRGLHVHELATLNSNFLEVANISSVWGDYLHARYRLDVAAEPRALVVADTLTEFLKRAPQTMARHYRRAAALGLRELLARFNTQRVPASLLHYDRFSQLYKGSEADEMAANLDSETDLIRLPQIVHVASSKAFRAPVQLGVEEERCAIAHGFDAGQYTDANEIVWLAAEIESKLEAGRGLTEVWCDRLIHFSRACGFGRVRLWLVSPEGFTEEASELLREREAYGSSRQQLELLTARLGGEPAIAGKDEEAVNEYELAIPMGEDSELIAAHTVEQIARRFDFQPEAINQIKTALIEACINAVEHSLSPDKKIYQRFRVEDDRLVVTVSSRGVVPPNLNNGSGEARAQANGNSTHEAAKERRGWGLKLIRTLMDEVEFERVDDGTRLRMVKYLHKK